MLDGCIHVERMFTMLLSFILHNVLRELNVLVYPSRVLVYFSHDLSVRISVSCADKSLFNEKLTAWNLCAEM